MIRYALHCDAGHAFESWFPSGDSFDRQVAGDLVACPVCGSAKVTKQIMAPRLGRTSGRVVVAPEGAAAAEAAAPPAVAAPSVEPNVPVALLSERDQAVRSMLRAIRDHVVKNADNVGRSFADEARRMHYGDVEHRSIYGQTDPAEARALIEEGIDVQPLPSLPDDRN